MNLKEVYDNKFFAALSQSLQKFCPDFDKEHFLKIIFDQNWQNRELKDRMRHICLCLNQILTKNYQKDIEILKKTAKDVKIESKYPGLSLIIFANYVEIFGLEDFETSISALEEFTSIGSAEFAIRPFFVKYPKETLETLLLWSKSDNYHVRRLASEGSRPRLPWGIALKSLKKDPSPILPILENLKDDESEYVRRSVANNLNDICKDNPKIALDLAKKWLKIPNKNTEKLVRHGIRTLLKGSDQEALNLFGYFKLKNPTESFDLQKLAINIGQPLVFSFNLTLKEQAKLRLEYSIYFLLKNQKSGQTSGQKFSRKVFQITNNEFGKGEYFFEKKHSFKEITTRKYYPGKHKIALMVNGLEVESKDFLLEIAS